MLKDSLHFLAALDLRALLSVFWYFAIFEIPRYTLSTIAVGLHAAFRRPYPCTPAALPVSVLMVGHNEAHGLVRSVTSLREQTHGNLQIVIVDDGSTEPMAKLAHELQQQGLVDTVVAAGIRGGKAAALNLGLHYCRHDLIVVADIDTSFDCDAIEHLLRPLVHDPSVGAVGGNLAVRNPDASLLTRFQALEYFSNISLGRQFTSMFGILAIVSGAFGAFRRRALEDVGGWDVGPGDDSNVTTKIRLAGWRIVFESQAWALTDVPATDRALDNQRLRWNRSLIRNRWRKFRSVFDPFQHNFSATDLIAALNLLWFHLVLTFAWIGYITYLILNHGADALVFLLALHILVIGLDYFEFLVAMLFVPRPGMWRLLPYVPGMTFYVAYYMRLNRLRAYVSELIFRRSYLDPFYPSKVRNAQDQF
jgi:poly-beta-1,6-N-acetyl-D-glucosamine synthase